MPLIQNAGPGNLAGDLAEVEQDTFDALMAAGYATVYISAELGHAVRVPDALYRDHKGKRVYLSGDNQDAPIAAEEETPTRSRKR